MRGLSEKQWVYYFAWRGAGNLFMVGINLRKAKKETDNGRIFSYQR
jgi:hypothetical protein